MLVAFSFASCFFLMFPYCRWPPISICHDLFHGYIFLLFFKNLTPHLCKRTKYIGHGMCVIVGMNLKYYAGFKIWQKPGVYMYITTTAHSISEGKFIFWAGFLPPALTSCCIWDSLTLNRSLFFFCWFRRLKTIYYCLRKSRVTVYV